MSNTPAISIVTACYNAEATIGDTLRSMAGQIYHDVEHIIVDGGSKDKTHQIIAKYKTENSDKQITFISEKDEGIYDAFNKGIALAKGDIIGILNADDWYEPDALQNVAEAFNESPDTEIVYGMERVIKDNREFALRFWHHSFLPDQMLSHPAMFVKADVYRKMGVFNKSYKIAGDYDFIVRCFTKGINFKPLYKILVNFRWGGVSNNPHSKYRNLREVYKVLLAHGYMSKNLYKLRTFATYVYQARETIRAAMIRTIKNLLDKAPKND